MMNKKLILVILILSLLFFSSSINQAKNQSIDHHNSFSNYEKTIHEYFTPSWIVGNTDVFGQYMGGTEILHLVGHNEKLFAASGYWMDKPYAIDLRMRPWPGVQILRLDNSSSEWIVDVTLPGPSIRATALESIRFKTDGFGKQLNRTINLLVVGTQEIWGSGRVLTRNDNTGNWEMTTLGESPEISNTIRAFIVYHDNITGVDRLFAAAGVEGIVSGVYNSSSPGCIEWGAKPEIESLPMRPMGFAICNNHLYVSSETSLYRRMNGEHPSWKKVFTSTIVSPDKVTSAGGGIRGLTTISSPGDNSQSLLFFLNGMIIRVEPSNDYKEILECNLQEMLTERLGQKVESVLGAYNDMVFLSSNEPNETLIFGVEIGLGYKGVLISGRPFYGNWDGGEWIVIRNDAYDYDLSRIDNGYGLSPSLVAVRTIEPSPFANDEDALYVGGFDCNYYASRNTAWIYQGSQDIIHANSQYYTSPANLSIKDVVKRVSVLFIQIIMKSIVS